jgi:transcription elongation factor SPT6
MISKDITEVNKPSANAIGQLLIIGTEQYTDLDQIIAQHVQPAFRYCQDVMRHDKYRPGTYQENFDHLKGVMTAAPNRVPYLFGINYEQPGSFYLMYQMAVNKEAETQVSLHLHNTVISSMIHLATPLQRLNKS